MTKRTDPHRPGAIIPAHYEDWLYYSLPASEGGWPLPPINLDCAWPMPTFGDRGQVVGVTERKCPDTGRCCVRSAERRARAEGREIFGSGGKCGVCGACFTYGSMFRHESGAMVHMGHDCADKYGAMYDASAWEVENGRVRAAAAKALTRSKNAEERDGFLREHPGLEDALAVDHPIIRDIGGRFAQYRSISDKQVALVMKLADEVRNPRPPAPEDVKVEGPTGKAEFRGTIVSAKVVEGDYGSTWKITVKVQAEGGCWLAWGTAPQALLDEVVEEAETAEKARRDAYIARARAAVDAGEDLPEYEHSRSDRPQQVRDGLKGREVCLSATLEAGREPHFRFMKRPSVWYSSPVPWKPVKKPRAKRAANAVAS